MSGRRLEFDGPAARFALHVGEAVLIADADDRRDLGLDHWVDGTLGLFRRKGRTTAVAPNGRALARHDVTEKGLLAGLVTPFERIESLPLDVEHASGGPVFHHEESDSTVLVYHGETFTDGDPEDYYSFLGLAASVGGGPFTDLGRIISSDIEDFDPSRPRQIEVGPGGFLVRDGWMLVYFIDRFRHGARQRLGVAGARLSDVLDGVARGQAPAFRKWTGAGFDEPGVGGQSIELLAGCRFPVMWFDVAALELVGQSLCVFSTLVRTSAGRWGWNHAASVSSDGLLWSEPQLLYAAPESDEMLYVTILSGQEVSRSVGGDTFGVLRVRAAAGYRWDDAIIERVPIRIEC